MSTRKPKQTTIQLYMNNSRAWLWRAVASNGRIIAASTEGQNTIGKAKRSFETFADAIKLNNVRMEINTALNPNDPQATSHE
jgi:uncharacterized protein YegP (UPF0339 family)